jgi:hypothetical protein
MVVAVAKSAAQNSAYRHHIMKGASKTERPSPLFTARAIRVASILLPDRPPLRFFAPSDAILSESRVLLETGLRCFEPVAAIL